VYVSTRAVNCYQKEIIILPTDLHTKLLKLHFPYLTFKTVYNVFYFTFYSEIFSSIVHIEGDVK